MRSTATSVKRVAGRRERASERERREKERERNAINRHVRQKLIMLFFSITITLSFVNIPITMTI
jgi:cell division septal protein FtsQ